MGDSDEAYSETVCPRCFGSGKQNLSPSGECDCYFCKGTGHISTKMDMFQGCQHNLPPRYTWDATGYPRTTEPRKTWLDECAMMAMGGMLANDEYSWVGCDIMNNENGEQSLSKKAYQIAEAMLAEKMKREAKE